MKLLQKTIRSYFVYSVFILLVAIPVFYYVIQRIVREDVDEDLLATKLILKTKISAALKNSTIEHLNFLDKNISVTKTDYRREFDSLITMDIYDSVSAEMVPYRILKSNFNTDNRSYLLQIKTSLVDNDDLIQSIVNVQVILLLLLLGGLFIINSSLSRRIWKPFYITLDKLRNYKVERHTSLALTKSSVNEFNDLNASLEELTLRTHQSYLSQKEFTENASHEMQTPLAVFQSKLELLMQTSPLNEEQAQLMGELADASRRMVRLNKSLLLLVKIENHQFQESESITVGKLIEDYLRQYNPQITQKKIAVSLKLQPEMMIAANRALIETLIINLLGNAIRHNQTNGSINIFLDSHSLIIQNTWKSSALDESRLFRRFQKNSGDSSSIGLGLEIIKQICNLYGFQISYQFIDGLHSFTILFNTA